MNFEGVLDYFPLSFYERCVFNFRLFIFNVLGNGLGIGISKNMIAGHESKFVLEDRRPVSHTGVSHSFSSSPAESTTAILPASSTTSSVMKGGLTGAMETLQIKQMIGSALRLVEREGQSSEGELTGSIGRTLVRRSLEALSGETTSV